MTTLQEIADRIADVFDTEIHEDHLRCRVKNQPDEISYKEMCDEGYFQKLTDEGYIFTGTYSPTTEEALMYIKHDPRKTPPLTKP